MLSMLSWKNLWRNKTRSLITIASVFFAVVLSVLMTSIQRGAMQSLVKDVVSFYSSYIQVHKKGYFEDQTLDNVLDVNDSLIAEIKLQKNVQQASPRIETFALASTGDNTQGCMVTGLIPSQEREIIQLGKKIKSGVYMADTGTGVMVAEGLARKLNLSINDTVMLLGQGYQGVTAAGRYAVKTIVIFGSPQLNDKLLLMPIKQAQQFLSAPGKATSIVVSIDDQKPVAEIQKGIATNIPPGYEVINWKQMMPEIVQLVNGKESGGIIITLLLYMLVSFGMFATLLMMMAERKYEIGMLMAIGMKKWQLARMVVLESIFVSLVGCATGIAVSVPLVYFLASHPIQASGQIKKVYETYGFEGVMPAATNGFIFYNQLIIIGIVSLLLSAYPAFKIFRMNALNAMKK